MAKGQWRGVSGVARKVINQNVGVNGVARKVTNGFIGVRGVARQFFENVSRQFTLQQLRCDTGLTAQLTDNTISVKKIGSVGGYGAARYAIYLNNVNTFQKGTVINITANGSNNGEQITLELIEISTNSEFIHYYGAEQKSYNDPAWDALADLNFTEYTITTEYDTSFICFQLTAWSGAPIGSIANLTIESLSINGEKYI